MDLFGPKFRQSAIMRSGRRQKKDAKKNVEKTGEISTFSVNGETTFNTEYPEIVDVKYHRDLRNCRITGMKFVSNGDLALIDSSNHCLKVIDLRTMMIKSWTEIRYKPWDLFEFERGEVVVTCPINKKLLFISLSNGFNYRQLLLGGVCYGVIVHNGTFIVSFTYPSPEVQFLSQDGHKLKSVSILTTGQPLFKCPRYLSLSADRSSFYVSDCGNDTVTKVTMTGGIEAIYQNRRVKNPRGIVIQGKNSVFVTGWGSNNVTHVTASCDHIDHVLNERNGVHIPLTLAVRHREKSSVMELFVCHDGSKQNVMSIYRLK